MSTLRLLAIETSSATATIGLAIGGELAEREIDTPREQAGRVLGLVDELLAAAGIGLADLDALVFGQGPGSFTGLRVAAAVAQGLSLGSGRPIVPVSSLAALAQRALAGEAGTMGAGPPGADSAASAAEGAAAGAAGADSAASAAEGAAAGEASRAAEGAAASAQRVLCCVDAHMGEVYWASFALVDGLAAPLAPEAIGTPASLQPPAAPYIAVGDGLRAHAAALRAVIAGASASDASLYPRARDLLALARGRVERGDFVALESALPLYLREATAWRSS